MYVSVAPNRTGRGKITLTAQGAYTELDAVTDEDTRIAVDERVVITEIGVDYMVVRRVNQAASAGSAGTGAASDGAVADKTACGNQGESGKAEKND